MHMTGAKHREINLQKRMGLREAQNDEIARLVAIGGLEYKEAAKTLNVDYNSKERKNNVK